MLGLRLHNARTTSAAVAAGSRHTLGSNLFSLQICFVFAKVGMEIIVTLLYAPRYSFFMRKFIQYDASPLDKALAYFHKVNLSLFGTCGWSTNPFFSDATLM